MKKLILTIALLVAMNGLSTSQVRRTSIALTPRVAVTATQQAALARLQGSGGKVAVAWSETNGTPAFLAGRLAQSGYLKTFAAPRDAAVGYIAENRELFKLGNPEQELSAVNAERDGIGMTHVRLQQMYQGLRVVGSQMIVHFAADGSVSSVNGRFIPTPQIDVNPAIGNVQAFLAASTAVSALAISSELVVYLNGDSPVLAYEVKCPTPNAPQQKATVDGSTGAVLDIDDGIRYDGPDVGSGPGLSGATRPLNIYLSGGLYYLIDATKAMYTPPITSLTGVVETWNAHNDTTDPNRYALVSLVSDPNGDKVFNDSATFAAAVDAHYFTGKVYDYYKTHFNRESWNDAGGSLMNVVHYLSRYNNAFWNGSFMSYGDGDGVEFSNLAGAFDVITHEITHGVTQSTANLEYRGQSGALNESYSDVMAAMADSANWTIGEDVYTPSIPGDALRDLSDPHQGGTSLSDPGWQPAVMSEYVTLLPYTPANDNGGVHINSGITNHAAFYVAGAIGRGKTEQIYYRTLTQYLTPKSLFVDARILTLQAAGDLYGTGGPEYAAVATAFDNVGITSSLPRTNELAYDDGSPYTGVYEADANWGLVNRMTVAGGGSLLTVEFYYRGENAPSGNGSIVLKVFSDSAGQPGSSLFTSTPLALGTNNVNVWFVGNLPHPVAVGQDFYVGLFYDGVNQPLVGADSSVNGRAWEWDNGQQKWILLDRNSYFPVTLFIRAVVSTPTGIQVAGNTLPTEYSLSQNYPNPFNPTTTIRYALPQRSPVVLTVFNLLGEEVSKLVAGEEEAGFHEVRFDATNLASGVYLYRIDAGNFVQTKKLMLLR